MPSKAVDFLVLGGGPAGAVFGALAARDGAKVKIAERDGYNMWRAGEYLEPGIGALLQAIGIPGEVLNEVSHPSPAIVSLWDSPLPLTQTFRERNDRPSMSVIRHLFDQVLLENAARNGAEILKTTGSISALKFEDKWRINLRDDSTETETIAHYIIDATGRNGAFARQLGIHRENTGDLIATALWFAPASPRGNAVGPLVIEAAGSGWWSLTETPDNSQVAVYYSHKSVISNPRVSPTEHALNCLPNAPYINARLQRSNSNLENSRSFAAFPSILSQVAGDRWVAIGDAAAAYDPLCGKGTLFAIQSACKAYEACTEDFNEFSAIYSKAVRSRFTEHVEARKKVYEDAGNRLSPEFIKGI